jgi:serine O-acetyltransferase
MKELLEIIKRDLYRYRQGDFNFKNIFLGCRSQGFRYLLFRRLFVHFQSNLVLSLVFKFILKYYTNKFGFQIGGKLGSGFYIGHFGTIIVSVNSEIGENCNIAAGVTIGATRRGGEMGAPQIGNRVWIGTNSVLVGKIKIGDNVLIAPCSYVNFNVPSDSIVLGNPGKIISKPNATDGYINNTYDMKL